MSRKVVITLVLATFLVAAWLVRGGNDRPGVPVSVSFAYMPTADAALLYVALEEGLFDRHGVRPLVTELAGGSRIIESVAAGEVDVGLASTLSFLHARAAGIPMLPIGAVRVVDKQNVRAALLVRPDAGIVSVADLRGRAIAVNTSRGIVELALRKVLRNAGVEPSAVRFVEIPLHEMETALHEGRVDAVSLAEPYWTRAGGRMDLHAVSYFLGDAYPVLELAGWFTLSSWREGNGEAARAVGRVFRDAADWLGEPANEVRARAIIARHTGTDSLTAANMVFPAFRPSYTLEHLSDVVTDMLAHGFLDLPLAVDSSLLVRR